MQEDQSVFDNLQKYFPITYIDVSSISPKMVLNLAKGSIVIDASSLHKDVIMAAGYDSLMQVEVPQLKDENKYDEFAKNLRSLISYIESGKVNPLLFFYIPQNPFSSTYNRFNVTVDLLKSLLKKESNRMIVFYEESSKVLNMLLYALVDIIKEKERIKILSKNLGTSGLNMAFALAVNTMARLEGKKKGLIT